MRSIFSRAVVVLFCWVGGIQVAQAALLTFIYTATITRLDLMLGAPAEFSVGSSITGRYTFNSLDNDSQAATTHGYYLSSISWAEIAVGSFVASGSSYGNILVIDSSSDNYIAEQMNPGGTLANGFELQGIRLSMSDTTATALTSDALLLTPPDLANFNSNTLTVDFDRPADGVHGAVTARLDALIRAPEPTSALPLSLLVPALLFAFRRRTARGLTQG